MEINEVSGNARSVIIVELAFPATCDILAWKRRLGWNCDFKAHGGRLACLMEISSEDELRSLSDSIWLLHEEFSVKTVIWLYTDRDWDGLRVASFVCEFYRRVGGVMSFGFSIRPMQSVSECRGNNDGFSISSDELRRLAREVKKGMERDGAAHRVAHKESENLVAETHFRMVGVTVEAIGAAKEKFRGFSCDWHQRPSSRDFVGCIRLDNPSVVQELVTAIHSSNLECEMGIYVSLRTSSESGEVVLDPHVSEFYGQVGGTIDFSFVSICDD